MALNNKFIFPAGVCMDYAGSVAPLGWLLCYGQAISRATYKALFDAIGTTYGVGDGVSTFNLPDVRGRTRFAKDNMGGVAANRVTAGESGLNAAQLGAVGGTQVVTLTNSELPSHNHTLGNGNIARPVSGTASAYPTIDAGVPQNSGTGSQGSSGAHVNIPPSITFNYIISTGA